MLFQYACWSMTGLPEPDPWSNPKTSASCSTEFLCPCIIERVKGCPSTDRSAAIACQMLLASSPAVQVRPWEGPVPRCSTARRKNQNPPSRHQTSWHPPWFLLLPILSSQERWREESAPRNGGKASQSVEGDGWQLGGGTEFGEIDAGGR